MTWNSSPLRLNPPSRASNPLRVPNNAQPSARFRCGGAPHLFRPQSRLPQMIGQMIGTTQQDGETVAQRFLQKVFLRHGAVLLQPVSRRETCKPLQQSAVNFSPGLPNQLDRWDSGLRLIGIGNERDIKLRMEPLPNTQQWEHRVVSGREMSPQIDQAVFSRCDFFQNFLITETGKHFVGSFDVSLPSVQCNC